MKKNKLLLLIAISVLVATGARAQGADAIIGKWLSESGEAKIEIFKSADKYYGKIAWLKNPLDENGQTKVDKKNPDPEKRSQKIFGLLMLKSFVHDGDEWNGGTIYDPKEGKEYNCRMTMNPDGSLNIRGYVGISLLGRTTVWKKTE